MAHSTTTLVNQMQMYLPDLKKPRAWWVLQLNKAYRKVVRELHVHYLNELQTLQEDIPLDSDGYFDLGNLTTAINDKHRGIIIIRYDGGQPADLISHDEYKELLYDQTTPGQDNPVYMSWGDKIRCWPHSTLTDVATGSLVVGTKYYNLGYTSVTYNGSAYTDTQGFTCVAGVLTYTTSGSGIVAASPQLIDIYYLKAFTDMDETTTSCLLSDEVKEIIAQIACGKYNPDEYAIGMQLLNEMNDSAYATDSNRTGRGPMDYLESNRRGGEGYFDITINT